MRGKGVKNILTENMMAMNPYISVRQVMNQQKRMCWKCQKDKSVKGGHIKTYAGGTAKFICQECVEARKRKENT